MALYVTFSPRPGSAGKYEKLLFSKTKIWNWFYRVINTYKALNHSMSQNLWGVLVCRQLWILYSKINFEVLQCT